MLATAGQYEIWERYPYPDNVTGLMSGWSSNSGVKGTGQTIETAGNSLAIYDQVVAVGPVDENRIQAITPLHYAMWK